LDVYVDLAIEAVVIRFEGPAGECEALLSDRSAFGLIR
jgi:hypothetical protein